MKKKLIEIIENSEKRDHGVDFRAGDTIKISYNIVDGDKERIQVFEGLVIAKNEKTFVARKVTLGIGIERIIPINSPLIKGIEVVKRGRVRRAKLYYIRDKKGKDSKIREIR
jgi:large subunit ribosomal protein L19